MPNTEPWRIELVNDATSIDTLSAIHRAAFMAHNVSPLYPRNILSSYLELPDIEKYWEESIADPARTIYIARLGSEVLGMAEVDTPSPYADTITGLYVSYPPAHARIGRTLFDVVAEEAIRNKKASLNAVVPEGSHLRTFYQGHGMREVSSVGNPLADPISLANWIKLSQVTLTKNIVTT